MDDFIEHYCAEPSTADSASEYDDEIILKAIAILDSRLQRPEFKVTQPEDARNYFRLQLAEREFEAFCVMFLDNQHGYLGTKEMFRGTIDGASVHPREVVKASMHFNAAAVIFAHNHPSGIPDPSQADKRITERLKSALALVDVRVLDHIIVGGTGTYSFAEHGML